MGKLSIELGDKSDNDTWIKRNTVGQITVGSSYTTLDLEVKEASERSLWSGEAGGSKPARLQGWCLWFSTFVGCAGRDLGRERERFKMQDIEGWSG